MIERVCRAAALAIVVTALVDPACIVTSAPRPRVLVMDTAGTRAEDRAAVIKSVSPVAELVTTEAPDIAARIIVGRVPPTSPVPDGVVVAVLSDRQPGAVTIERVEAPSVADLESTVMVQVAVGVPATPRATMHTWLEADGVVLDRRTVVDGATGTRLQASLAFTPARPGLARLRVHAQMGDGPVAVADTAVEVVRRTRQVLVHDARPSWATTFVRRALESDPRVVVTARSVVSRGLNADAGAPPALDAANALDGFDAVVIGAAERLTPREITALERYLRDREGAVVLLPTDVEMLSTVAPLTGVQRWTLDRRPALESVGAGGVRWTASEFIWPSTWPSSAEALTDCLVAAPRCPVWKRPVGGGRVVVSSALDGWRTRAAESTAFLEFWRSLIVDEASATPAPVEISLTPTLSEAGQVVRAHVESRVAAAGTAEWQDTLGGVQPVRLWPAGERRWTAEFRAPAAPGRYRLVVRTADASGQAASREFMVVEPASVQPPSRESTTALASLATSRGGRALPMSEVDQLPAVLSQLTGATSSPAPVYPMRSAWLIVPFAGLLSIEWWLRRRRGAR